MVKRVLSYALLFTIAVSFLTLGLIYGDNERDQLNSVQNEIGKTQKALNEGQKEEKNLLGQIQALENQVRAAEGEIDSLRGGINDLQAKINEAAEELDGLQAQLDEQNEQLNGRLRAMYMNGNIGVLDVLLGSSSISDFMTNMDRIQLIYESDREVIESLEEQHRVLDAHRQSLEEMQAQLVAAKEQEANKKETLKQSQKAVSAKKAEISQNNKALEEMIKVQTEEANRLISVILAKQSDSDYVGGDLAWPVPGATRITSKFGYRIHPILKTKQLHTGIDIAAPSGTKVVAANAGTVLKAEWNNSYGYMVIIDHGGGIVTLYAHNSSLLVKEGDIVTRGQVISLSGSTGMSTGPHVHFEVRINGEYKDPELYL